MTRPISLEHLTMIDAAPFELIDAAAAGGFDIILVAGAPIPPKRHSRSPRKASVKPSFFS